MLDSFLGYFKSFASMPTVTILSGMIAGQFVQERFGTRLLPDYGRYDDVVAVAAFAVTLMALIPTSVLPAGIARFDLVDY